jgi:hypothetical protein
MAHRHDTERLSEFSCACVTSVKGEWAIMHLDDPVTPPKIQKCRVCHGVGQQERQVYCSPYYEWEPVYKKEPCPHGHNVSHVVGTEMVDCWRCHGMGSADYGSKPIHTPWPSGYATVDADGRVLSVETHPHENENYTPSWQTCKYNPSVAYDPVVTKPPYATGEKVLTTIARLVPDLERLGLCPACGLGSPYNHLVMHLNDTHRWTREQIADWLETLDINININPKENSNV